MGLILDLMAETGASLSGLVAQLPKYEIVKDKLAVAADRLAALLGAVEKRWPEARVDRRDGLRLDWPDRWLHIRPSNTEPIVRVIAEAPSAEVSRKLCRQVAGMLV